MYSPGLPSNANEIRPFNNHGC